MTATPPVLVFDVNETLIDIDAMAPLFDEIFGDARVMREWFGQVVMYSMTTALSGCTSAVRTLAFAPAPVTKLASIPPVFFKRATRLASTPL